VEDAPILFGGMLTDIMISEKTRSTIYEDMARCDSSSDYYVPHELGYRGYGNKGGNAIFGLQK
tara:strand:+ start:243 stop:431 length:189 start_codon:yes stop_codon:yes gene_type:complete